MLPKVPSFVISSDAPSLSFSDLSFATDPSRTSGTGHKPEQSLGNFNSCGGSQPGDLLNGENHLHLMVLNFTLLSGDIFVVLFFKVVTMCRMHLCLFYFI